MINGFVHLKRCLPEDLAELKSLAESENHGVFNPLFTVRKDNTIGGWVSVNGVPYVFAHLSSKVLTPRDSFEVINSVENHVQLGGASGVVWPVPKTSPFHPLAGSLGYRSLGTYELFYKDL